MILTTTIEGQTYNPVRFTNDDDDDNNTSNNNKHNNK